MAPIRAVAYCTNTHSGRFGDQIPTRSPGPTPSPTSARASVSTSSSSSRYVHRRPLGTSASASRSPTRRTVRRRHPPMVSPMSGSEEMPLAYETVFMPPGCAARLAPLWPEPWRNLAPQVSAGLDRSAPVSAGQRGSAERGELSRDLGRPGRLVRADPLEDGQRVVELAGRVLAAPLHQRAPGDPGPRVRLVPRALLQDGQVQGVPVQRLRLTQRTAQPLQRAHLVQRRGLAAAVPELVVDRQRLAERRAGRRDVSGAPRGRPDVDRKSAV